MKKQLYLIILILLNISALAQWNDEISILQTEAKDRSETNELDTLIVKFTNGFQTREGIYIDGDTLYIDTSRVVIPNMVDTFNIVYGTSWQPEGWVSNGETILIDTTKAADELPAGSPGDLLYYEFGTGWTRLPIGGNNTYLKSVSGTFPSWVIPNFVPFTGAMYDVDLNTHSLAAREVEADSATFSGLKYPREDGDSLDVMYTDGEGNLGFRSIPIDSIFIAYSDTNYVAHADSTKTGNWAFPGDTIYIDTTSFTSEAMDSIYVELTDENSSGWVDDSIRIDTTGRFDSIQIVHGSSWQPEGYVKNLNQILFDTTTIWKEDDGYIYHESPVIVGTDAMLGAGVFALEVDGYSAFYNTDNPTAQFLNNSTNTTVFIRNDYPTGNPSVLSLGGNTYSTAAEIFANGDIETLGAIEASNEINGGSFEISGTEVINSSRGILGTDLTVGTLAYPTSAGSENKLWSFDASGNIVFVDAPSAGLWSSSTNGIYYSSGGVGIGKEPAAGYDLDISGRVAIGAYDAGASVLFASANATNTTAIYGSSNYATGKGLLGYNSSSGYGVYGESIDGYGGFFTSDNSYALRINGSSGGAYFYNVLDNTNDFIVFDDTGAKIEYDGKCIFTAAELSGLTYPTADGTNGQLLGTNGSGVLGFYDSGNHWSSNSDGIYYNETDKAVMIGTDDPTVSSFYSMFVDGNVKFVDDTDVTVSVYGSSSSGLAAFYVNAYNGVSVESENNGITVATDNGDAFTTFVSTSGTGNHIKAINSEDAGATVFSVDKDGDVYSDRYVDVGLGYKLNGTALNVDDLSSGTASSGQLPIADGAGGVTWGTGSSGKAYGTLSGTSPTLTGGNWNLTLSGNTTITVSLSNGDEGNIIVTCPATAYTLDFNVTERYRGQETYTPTASQTDILSYTYNGTDLFITYGTNY